MQRRWTSPVVVLSVLCTVLFLITAYLFVRHAMLTVRVMFAREQIRIIADMMEETRQKPISDEYLDYAKNYYPSGSKQVAGSRLDEIVEQYRSLAVAEIERELEERRTEYRATMKEQARQGSP